MAGRFFSSIFSPTSSCGFVSDPGRTGDSVVVTSIGISGISGVKMNVKKECKLYQNTVK